MRKKNFLFSFALLLGVACMGALLVSTSQNRFMLSKLSMQKNPADPNLTEVPAVGDVVKNATLTDYTSSIANPGFEVSDEEYLIYWTKGKGSLPYASWTLDYDVNGCYVNFFTRHSTINPVEGSYYVNVSASRLKSFDMYQVVEGLPSGYYQIKGSLRNTDGRSALINDQHVYAEVDGYVYDSPVMSEASLGMALINWEELATTSFLVSGEMVKIRLGVRSTGNGTDFTGWFQADNFKLVRVGDATPEEISAYYVKVIENWYANAKEWLNSLNNILVPPYDGILVAAQNAMDAVDAKYNIVKEKDDWTDAEFRTMLDNMDKVLETPRAGVELVNRLNLCEANLKDVPDEHLETAVAKAKMVAEADNADADAYVTALTELMAVWETYSFKIQNPSDWTFNGQVKSGSYSFQLDKAYKVACIDSYLGDEANVVIPNNVIVDNIEYTVVGVGTEYGSYAFNNKIVSVEFPATLRFIGSNAFRNCSNLEKVEVPELVDSVGSYAFNGCTKLREVILPDRLRTIDSYAFSGCTELTSIDIPNSVTNIGGYAFSGCTGLTAINVDKENPNFISIDGVLCNKDVTRIIICPQRKKGTFRLPNSVTSIEGRAFGGCTGLTNIDIPNSVTNIGEYAFYNCTGLTSINIPNSVTNIENYVFYNCTGLTNINIPNSVTNIENYVFYNCTGLTNINIPNSVTNIENYVFSRCTGLTSIDIPNSVTNIGNYAFNNCSSLQSATIKNEGNIGEYAFGYCSSLQSLDLRNTGSIGRGAFIGCSSIETLRVAPSVTSIDDNAFRGCKSLSDVIIEDRESELSLGRLRSLFRACPLDEVYIGGKIVYNTGLHGRYSPFYRNTSLRAVTITDQETTIYDGEFYGCSGLKNVKIGDGVTSIGEESFSGCSAIESFEFGKHVETIGANAFSDCTAMTKMISHNPVPPICDTGALDDINKEKCTLYVPGDMIDAYKVADQWKNFFFIEDLASTSIENVAAKKNKIETGRYDLGGRKVSKAYTGVVIIRYSDGTTRMQVASGEI